MSVAIRPVRPVADFARVAELLTLAGPPAFTAEELREDEDRQIAGKIRRRAVAVDGAEQVVGYSYAVHYPSEPAGRFYLTLTVDPARRRQGIGTALYDDVLLWLRAQGAHRVYTEIREESPAGLAFARRRGFTVSRHAIESALDLATFDAARFAGLMESVEAGGIRFFSLADTGGTPDALRRLYAINRIASTDDPASPDDSFPTFDVWQRIIVQASGFQPEGQIIAADGDAYVGLAAVQYDAETQSAESLLTGVDRAYRGRKIAQALKLLTVRFAQARGATHIVTENDARNTAMIVINRKLGFQSRPGYYELIHDLR
jgi:RimJ/RimL family protein N-acetyltransferase